MSSKPRFPVSNPLESFWTAESHPLHNHRSSIDLPRSTDVVIIGSGYAGVATAYHLMKDNPTSTKIVILEARSACSGATGRNGGHLKPDTYFNIPKYTKLYGKEEAAKIAKFEFSQIFAVKELVDQENIDCDFHLTRAVDVCMDSKHALDTELAYRELVTSGHVDTRDVAFVPQKDAERISGVKGAKCAFTFTAGHIWPSKMVLHLLSDLINKGVNLQTHTPVTSVSSLQDSSGLWTIRTPRGTISTRKIVFATNAFTSAILPQYLDKIIPVRGVCSHIATPDGRTAPYMPFTNSIRHSSSAYDYLIPRADGSIIVGGARSLFWHKKERYFDTVDDSTLIEEAKNYFDGYMQRHFRGWEDSGAVTKKVWTGIMGYSSDYVPHIGQVPKKPGQYILAGFSGHGMPQILLAAQAVSSMVKDGITYEDTGLPQVFKTTQERLTTEKNLLVEELEESWMPAAKL